MPNNAPLQMCRTCLQEGLNYVCLGTGENSYRYKLIICVPEINIDKLKNPALCDECALKLEEAYKFKRTCIESEKKLNETLTLENVLQPISNLHANNCEDTALNNSISTVKQMNGDDHCIQLEKSSIEMLNAIKQEPEATIFESDTIESHNLVIKEEPDFFYSEYDVDSKENNKVDLSKQEITTVNVYKILNEHSYFVNHFNSQSNTTACRQLHEKDIVNIQMEPYKTVKMVKAIDPEKDGYLRVKVEPERKYMCRYCNKIFDASETLYDHIHLSHNEEFISDNASKEILCKICNCYFDENAIECHLEIHKAENIEVNADSMSQFKLICRVCGDSFSSEKLFTTHYPTHKQVSVNTNCTICEETYNQITAKAHMEFHNTIQEIVLDSDVDETHFSSSNDELNAKYSVQIKASTSSSKPTNYKCCNEDFSNLYLYHLHAKTHGYICYVCNIKFPSKQALGGHVRTHNNQKTHYCKDCGKYFAQRGNLLRHTHLVHDSFLPFKCDQCGKRFRRNKYLEEHLRAHTQKYPCTECNRVFTELKSLRKHKRYHSPRHHQCEVCNSKFTAKSSLLRHIRYIHKLKITGKRSYGFGEVILGSK